MRIIRVVPLENILSRSFSGSNLFAGASYTFSGQNLACVSMSGDYGSTRSMCGKNNLNYSANEKGWGSESGDESL